MMRRLSGATLALVSAFVLGCGSGGGEFKPAAELPQTAHDDHDHHGHDHGGSSEGPHHGSLIELGEEEFHGEIVVDGKSHTLKLYLLGPDAKSDATTAATEATLTLEGGPTLTLKPAEGQTEGMVSLFTVTDDKAVHEIAEAEFIHGELSIQMGEKTYTAHVDAHFHGDHDHDHEKEMPADAPAAAPEAAEGPALDAPAEPKQPE
ncbi:hypothetical protein GC163_22900 [bacterium]|nr:hypothetical protein [bacterium]